MKESKELLKEAGRDENGIISKKELLGWLSIRTNGKEFVDQKNARSKALWKAVMDDLENDELIEDGSGIGTVYYVTHKGYSV